MGIDKFAFSCIIILLNIDLGVIMKKFLVFLVSIIVVICLGMTFYYFAKLFKWRVGNITIILFVKYFYCQNIRYFGIMILSVGKWEGII